MKAVFRVDASAKMGVGHLMRCLTLAESLRERDVQIHFICREHTGSLIALLQQKTMPVTALPASLANDTALGEDYAAWLGVTQADDAEQTVEALNGEKPDWLVIDHYGLDIEWEQRLRPHVNKLMVIDDLANRRHDCDVLLDQNYSAGGEQRYAGLVSDTCKLLVGPGYALLRPEYAAYRKTLRARDGQVGRVLVFFGGSDPQNMTGLALEALSHAELCHLAVDVVIGTNNSHREALERQSHARPQTMIYGLRPHLADLMVQADLAIGAGGATTWERMCLGLPTVVISIADNQRPASEALAEAKLIYYAGHFPDVKMDQLIQLIKQLGCDTEKLSELSIRNRHQVDGLGALRLVEKLCPSATDDIRLRSTSEEDMALYYNWANDPEVRSSAIQNSPIPWLMHKEWFAKKLNDSNSHLYVLEAGGLPVGQIRFDKEGSETRIDYSLDTLVRGRGWGARLVSLGMELLPRIEAIRLLAQVKENNKASRSVFLRLGFRMTENPGNYLEFRHNLEKQ
jgi:UDP-2,4-diacetamido-2,4,6-trideoxy-beta-L-altropyranose hydrolase